MERITSRDGTAIAYHRSGTGPPLVLVHGAGGANAHAWPAFPALEERFTVYAVDRRGRRESGDGSAYALEREFEDIACVVDAIGQPAHLLGHSYGGLCAMEASLLTQNLRKLVLYEPLEIRPPGIPLTQPDVIDRLQALLEAGQREEVVTTFYRIMGLSPQGIEQFKSSPAWPERLSAAQTLPRELQAEAQYTFDARHFRDLHTPTLLLVGSESSEAMKAGIQAIDAALPNSRVVVLPGQQHLAMYTAPDLFATEVTRFLQEPL